MREIEPRKNVGKMRGVEKSRNGLFSRLIR